MAYLGNTDPDGWVICDGVARTDSSIYNSLVGMGIGTRSGSNYTPPNYNGAFLRGTGTSNVNAVYAGPGLNTSQDMQLLNHTHTGTTVSAGEHTHTLNIQDVNNNSANRLVSTSWRTGGPYGLTGGGNFAGDASFLYRNSILSAGAHTHTFTTDNPNTGGTELRPFNFGVNWILKL